MSKRANGEGSIYKRRDGRWTAAVTLPNGKRKHLYARTRAEAEKKRRLVLRQMDDGLPLVDERVRVAEYLERFIATVGKATLKPRTLREYQRIIRQHLNPSLGRLKLRSLSPEQVQQYMNEKLAAGLSAQSVKNHHSVLRRALSDAERWGLVSRSVAKLVTPPRVVTPEIEPLTTQEARQLIDALGEDPLAPVYEVALSLGLRQGEILGLQWDHVDLEERTLRVSTALQRFDGRYHLVEVKSVRSRRTLPLPEHLVGTLRRRKLRQAEERLKAGSDWGGEWDLVFTTPLGQPLSGPSVTHRFQKLLAHAGIRRKRFHDLRHSCGSFMLAEGVPLRVAMEVLGHADISVTANTYSHVMPELSRDAAERVGSLLWTGG